MNTVSGGIRDFIHLNNNKKIVFFLEFPVKKLKLPILLIGLTGTLMWLIVLRLFNDYNDYVMTIMNKNAKHLILL